MKKILALVIAAALLGRGSIILAATQPPGDGNNGGTPPAAGTAPNPSSTETIGLVGAAAFVAAALVYAGVAIAQHQPHSSGSYSKPASLSGRPISGRVVSVDTAANTLVILTKQGETTLNVDPHAKIKVGKERRLSNLKTGAKIKVSCKIEGTQKIAARIW